MRVLQNIAYTTILGYPLIFYLGILTYVMLLVTLVIPVLNARVKRLPRISVRVHQRFGYITLALATVHGLLTLSSYL